MLSSPLFGSVSRVVGLAALGAGLFAVAIRRTLRPPGIELVIAATFVWWGAATCLWTVAPEESIVRLGTNIQLLGTVWLMWEFARTRWGWVWLMRAYVLGCIPSALATIYARVTTPESFRPDVLRYSAPGFNPNGLAMTLAIGVPLAWFVAATEKRRAMRWLYLLYLPLAAVAVFQTGSRGGFVTLAVAFLIVPLALRGMTFGRRASIVVLILVAGVGTHYLVTDFTWKRSMSVETEVSQGDLSGRTRIWSAGIQAFLDHPIAGSGVGSYPKTMGPVLGSERASHNAYLSVAVEQGSVGLSLFLLLVLLLLFKVRGLPAQDLRLALVLLAAWAVAASSANWEYSKVTWFLFGLLMASPARQQVRGPPCRGNHQPETEAAP